LRCGAGVLEDDFVLAAAGHFPGALFKLFCNCRAEMLKERRGYGRCGSIVFYRGWIEDRCLCGHCYGSQQFIPRRRAVKDMLALLRFIENPHDRVAGFRLMQLLPGVARLLMRPCRLASTPRIGGLSSLPLVICVQGARRGRPNWSTPVCGTSHAIAGLADLIQLEQIGRCARAR
jgi:hypothetical protein